MIDGKGGAPISQGEVLFDRNGIVGVGGEDGIRIPEGAMIKEHSFVGCTILPGLLDTHTHLNMPGNGRGLLDVMTEKDDLLLLRSAKNARTALHKGVTTLRDNGGRGIVNFSLRQAIDEGLEAGPQLKLCGKPITITGGHCWMMGGEADGVRGVRKAVRSAIKEGADYIKIMATGGSTPNSFPLRPSYTISELRAIVDEAHRFGKLTGAHCRCTAGVIGALDAGVDMLIHCDLQEPDGSWKFRPEVAERIAKGGVWVNPTLHVVRSIYWGACERMEREGPSAELDSELAEAKELWEGHRENFRLLRAAGVKAVAGGDTGWGYVRFGEFCYEIEAMHTEGGLTPMQAILSATRHAAHSLEMGDEVGTLEPGKKADILVVEGNPLEDLMDLMKVKAVFKSGNRIC